MEHNTQYQDLAIHASDLKEGEKSSSSLERLDCVGAQLTSQPNKHAKSSASRFARAKKILNDGSLLKGLDKPEGAAVRPSSQ